MSRFKRNFVDGGMFYFTLVTYCRRPILITDLGRDCLRHALTETRRTHPFRIFATVLLPDHLHLVMHLPQGDSNYPLRLKRMKEEFTLRWLHRGGAECAVTRSEANRGRRGIWQPRYWEHTIGDEHDLERCADDIHWNPRKHALADRVRDWPWSSFFRFVEQGQYDLDWGGKAPVGCGTEDDWGEPGS